MSERETLERIIKEARGRLREIEDAERVEEHAPLVGKCYKAHDCYSGPEKPEDYWWRYAMVYAVEDRMILWTFSRDVHGNVRIGTEDDRYNLPVSYEEITTAEFMSAWNDLMGWLVEKQVERFC